MSVSAVLTLALGCFGRPKSASRRIDPSAPFGRLTVIWKVCGRGSPIQQAAYGAGRDQSAGAGAGAT
jgi:hypothetical protein